MCGFLGSRATTLSSVICGFVLLAGQFSSHPPQPLFPWLFLLHIFLVCLLSAIEAKGQLRDRREGAGRPRKDAFPQRLLVILFLQVKSPG